MNIKFGTDGWRGRIADDFTFDNVARVIQAFCDTFLERGHPKLVFLGYDRRFLSREFALEAASVLTANGIETRISSQFCPTPCVSWMVKNFKAGAGVVITASHNPFEWNGVKFKEPDGGASSPEYTAPIEERFNENFKAGRMPKKISPDEARSRKLLVEFDPFGPYALQLRRMVDIDAINRAGWNIVADTMYGAGAGFFPFVMGRKIRELHTDANPAFGSIQPEPIAKNLGDLISSVSQGGIDVGLATDGDADRIAAVDEKGRFIDSHHIFALIFRHLVLCRRLKGEVVKTISTTNMIDRLGEKYGIKVHKTAVGFKHISLKFRDIAPMLGGEESGGIAIAEHVHERDGILSGLMLLEIMTMEKRPLGKVIEELEREIGPHRFERRDLHLPPEVVEALRERLADFAPGEVSGTRVRKIERMDGCYLDMEDGSWVLVRPSGTEPLVRLYAESSSSERVRGYLDSIRGKLGL